jgi:hypothetical protein
MCILVTSGHVGPSSSIMQSEEPGKISDVSENANFLTSVGPVYTRTI